MGKKAMAPIKPTMALKKGKIQARTVVMQTRMDRLMSFRGLIGRMKP